MENSDAVFLLTTLDIPSLKNLKIALETLRLVNFPIDRLARGHEPGRLEGRSGRSRGREDPRRPRHRLHPEFAPGTCGHQPRSRDRDRPAQACGVAWHSIGSSAKRSLKESPAVEKRGGRSDCGGNHEPFRSPVAGPQGPRARHQHARVATRPRPRAHPKALRRPVRRHQEVGPRGPRRVPGPAAVPDAAERVGPQPAGTRRAPRRPLARPDPAAGDRARRAGPADRRRDPRLRAARAVPARRRGHRGHGQRLRHHLHRALRQDRARRRGVQRRRAPAPDHRQDRRPGRSTRRRVLPHGRRPPARRLARQRDRPAAGGRRLRADDPQVRQPIPTRSRT